MAGSSDEVSLEELAPYLERLGTEPSQVNWEPALKIIAVLIAAATRENFEGQHAPDGTAWPALAHPRPSSQGGDQALRDFGFLDASVTGNGAGHIEEYEDNALTFGTNLDYARTQQEGDPDRHASEAQYLAIPLTAEAKSAGRARQFPSELFVLPSKKPDTALLAERDDSGNLVIQYVLKKSVSIPARPFLGFNDQLLEKIDDVFAEHVLSQFGSL